MTLNPTIEVSNPAAAGGAGREKTAKLITDFFVGDQTPFQRDANLNLTTTRSPGTNAIKLFTTVMNEFS
jgi:hypothetical protein